MTELFARQVVIVAAVGVVVAIVTIAILEVRTPRSRNGFEWEFGDWDAVALHNIAICIHSSHAHHSFFFPLLFLIFDCLVFAFG